MCTLLISDLDERERVKRQKFEDKDAAKKLEAQVTDLPYIQINERFGDSEKKALLASRLDLGSLLPWLITAVTNYRSRLSDCGKR